MSTLVALGGGYARVARVAEAVCAAATLWLLVPTAALAADPIVGAAVPGYGIGDWLSLTMRLALVLVAIWGAVAAMKWYVRRVNGDVGGVGRQMQLIESRPLGPNRSLQLVRLGGKAVLLGVTAERITTLLTIEDADEVERLAAAAAPGRDGRLAQVASGFGGYALGVVRSYLTARRARLTVASASTARGGRGGAGWRGALRPFARLAELMQSMRSRPSRARRGARSMSVSGTAQGTAAQRVRAAAAYAPSQTVVAAQLAIARARGDID